MTWPTLIAEDLRQDPWLRWWNHPTGNSLRALQELLGQRDRLDALAPTRPAPNCKRLPELFAGDTEAGAPPNSIGAIRFDHIYFCSQALKEYTEKAGFKVSQAEVIHPGIAAQTYVGEVKPPGAPLEKFLFVGRLTEGSGLLTAVQALKILRGNQVKTSLFGLRQGRFRLHCRGAILCGPAATGRGVSPRVQPATRLARASSAA